MSDMQTLIHTNAMHAYDQGVKAEKRRISKVLEMELTKQFGWSSDCDCKECPALSKLIEQVMVGQND